jgi:hypothetical protein
MKRKRNVFSLSVASLVLSASICAFGQTASPEAKQGGEKSTAKKKVTIAAQAEKDKESSEAEQQARLQSRWRMLEVLRATARGADEWEDASAAAKVQAQAADLMWEFDDATARSLLLSAWKAASHVENKTKEFSQFRNESPRNDARREVLIVARKRTPELAREWLDQMTEEAQKEQDKKEKKGIFDDRTPRSSVLLQMALASVEENRQSAAELAIESLADGISFGLQNVLIALQTKDFDLAQKVFRAALVRLKTSGFSDPNELFILSAYLYTPGMVRAAGTSENRGSFQLGVSRNRPQIGRASDLNPELAQEFLAVVADLLLSAPLPSTTANPEQTARTQISVIANLLPAISRTLPDKAALLQQRLSALEADAHFVPASTRSDVTAPREGESRESFAERRVDELEEAAKKEPSGLSRDIAYAKAALATGVERYERGWGLADKIDDKELRAGVRDWLTYRATLHFINRKQFAAAESLLWKNENLVQRGASLVVGAQKFLQAKDEVSARQWLENAAQIVKRLESNEDAVRLALGIVSSYGQFDAAMARESLRNAVAVMNKVPEAKLTDERAPAAKNFSGFTIPDLTYATKGFGLASASEVFGEAEFENAVQELSAIKKPETRGLALVALCRKNLLMRKQERAKKI